MFGHLLKAALVRCS